jgi:hypothetical protein
LNPERGVQKKTETMEVDDNELVFSYLCMRHIAIVWYTYMYLFVNCQTT